MKQDTKLLDHHDRNNTNVRSDHRCVLELNHRSVSRVDPHFRKVHDSAQRIVMDVHNNATDKFEQLLILGMQYLNLDSVVMGSVIGNTLDIVCLAGDVAKSNNKGDKLLIDETLFQQALNSTETLAIHNVPTHYSSESEAIQSDAINCFVGRRIDTANGPFGLIGFYSSQPTENPFTPNHIEVVNYIAESIGLIMGYEERIELITHHTELYLPMLHIVPAMILLCDQAGLIMANSARLYTMLGMNQNSMPGKNLRHFIHVEDHMTVNTALKKGNVNKVPITLCWNNDTRLDVEMSSCIKSIGITQGIRIIVLVDVSDRNTAIKEVVQQNKQLTRANQSLGQFASIASHDLQEPLRKIQQFGVFLQEDLDGQMTADVKHHLDVILKASNRMTGLVQDVLQLSRTAQGTPTSSKVNLSDLIDDVIDELELRIEEANAKLTVSALPVVRGDAGLIRQLFTNLISNSLKYRDYARNPIIIINAVFEGETLAIAIRDNGIGFDQEQTMAVFEPFSRLRNSADYSGNGIGLTICQKVCDQHNWTIDATSTPGSGSVFTIRIPDGQQTL